MLLSITSYSQNVTFEEVLKLSKFNLTKVEEYLGNKGWNYAGTSVDYGKEFVVFNYGKSAFSDAAQSFILYKEGPPDGRNILIFQLNNVQRYNSIVSRLGSLKFKYYDSKVENGKIIKGYLREGCILLVTVSTGKDHFDSTRTLYSFTLMTENK